MINTTLITQKDFNNFLQQGYLKIDIEKIYSCLGQANMDTYLSEIADYRHKASKFFKLPVNDKNTLMAPIKIEDEQRYYPGFWPASIYDDKIDGVDFVTEYLFSRDYYIGTEDTMFMPLDGAANAASPFVSQLPHQEGFSLCYFLAEQLFQPIKLLFMKSFNCVYPNHSLQIGMTHYPQNSILDWHRDKGFIMGIMGSATNLCYRVVDDEQETEIELSEGELIIHTGLQFRDTFPELARQLPKAIPHRVDAYAGRMSIIFNTFAEASKLRVFNS